LFKVTVEEKQEKYEADSSLRASPKALQSLASTVACIFISFSLLLYTRPQLKSPSAGQIRYSAGDSDVCVKMTLRTHF
jgi:hypothetical protein